MAKRANYSFQKRQKEIERQKKKEEKAAKKKTRKEGRDGGGSQNDPTILPSDGDSSSRS